MSARSETVGLAAGSVVNGLAAYAIVLILSRNLNDTDFATFSVAWSLWALSVALLVFPVQHWIIWRAEVSHDLGAVRSTLPKILVFAGMAVVALSVAGSSERLFESGDYWSVILGLIAVSSAGLGLGRGILAAKHRYASVAWVIGLENVLRLLAILGILAIGLGVAPLTLALALGVVALAPFATSLKLQPSTYSGRHSVLSELGALAGATAIAQALVQFPPAFAEWLGDGPERVSAIFATFSVGRAPLLIILGITTRLTSPLTHLVATTVRNPNRVLVQAWSMAAMLTLSSGVIGYTVGPQVVEFLFGKNRSLSDWETMAIASGLALAVVGVLATLVLMAMQANRLVALYWLFALLLAVVLGLAGLGIPTAFLVAEASAVVLCGATLSYLFQRRGQPGESS